MNKDKQLKQRLIKEGIVLGVICGVLFLIASGISMYASNVTSERDTLQSEKGGLTNTLQTLQTQLTKAKASLGLYQSVTQRNPKDGDLNREEAYTLLNQLRDRYYLSKLDVSISPVQELNDPKFKNASVGVISCEIKLGFEALSDEMVFRFVNAVQKEFPGYIRVVHFNLTRTGDVTPEIQSQFQNNQVPALVRGDMIVYWLGFKPQNAAESTQPPPGQGG